MMFRLAKTLRAPFLGTGVLLTLLTLPTMFGADLLVKGNIPFAFQVGNKTLPAGYYEIEIDHQRESFTVMGTNQEPDAAALILTHLAPPASFKATDAHLVFDKVGEDYILSEIWTPGADGLLVHATNGPHEHRVHHFKL